MKNPSLLFKEDTMQLEGRSYGYLGKIVFISAHLWGKLHESNGQ